MVAEYQKEKKEKQDKIDYLKSIGKYMTKAQMLKQKERERLRK